MATEDKSEDAKNNTAVATADSTNVLTRHQSLRRDTAAVRDRADDVRAARVKLVGH